MPTRTTNTLKKTLDGFGLQVTALEDPRTLRQRVLGVDLAALDGEA